MPARKIRTVVALPADLLEAVNAGIDAEFAQMATDPAYQEEAVQIAKEFAEADWEALQADTKSV
ncbi:MAG TPA: hypothetical protein VF173_28605 [Thermoanaerobaculia bacterium]|nr:hypothetical protein [Thermoanaerobaculia bacterium]